MRRAIVDFAPQFFGFGVNPGAVEIVLPQVERKRASSLRCRNYPLFRHELSPDDAFSALAVYGLLTGAYGDELVRVVTVDQVRSAGPESHRVLLGGPPTNPLVGTALRSTPARFAPDDRSRAINFGRYNYQVRFDGVRTGRSIVRDYCLVSRIEQSSRHQFLLSGLRAYGQLGAYYFLRDPEFYEASRREWSSAGSFQLLVEVEVRQRQIHGWGIVEHAHF